MADATATPSTIQITGSPQAVAAAQAVEVPSITVGTSIIQPAVQATTTTSATATTSPILASSSIITVSITTVQGVVSGVIKFDIRVTPDITAQLLGYQRYAEDGRSPEYRIVAVTPGGTPKAEFDEAIVNDISWVLNGAGTASFTMAVDDDKIGQVTVPDTEIQVWRGPDLMFQGPVVRAQGDDKTVTFQSADLSWYFTKRVVGAPETSYVPNGSFEEDLSQWFIDYNAYEPGYNRGLPYTVEVRTDQTLSGQKSLYIYESGQMTYGPQVASSSFEWTASPSSNEKGEQWYLVAWCYIPSSDWIAPRVISDGTTTAGMGALLQRFSSTETVTVSTVPGVPPVTYPRPIENVWLPIDNSTPKDQWIRMEVPFTQPITGDLEYIRVHLYAPIGGIYWDEVSLVRKEALYFNNVDQAQIVKGLVEHAQNPSYGKSDLRIGTSCPDTGVKRTREYEFFNHELISDTIDEWPGLWDGVDWSIDITPTTRTFRSHYPRRGATKTQHALVFGKNIATLNMAIDGEQTANSVLVMADLGDGAAREEGYATAPGSLADNLILETVYVATPGSNINSLNAQARRGVRRYQNPVTLPDLVLYQGASKELLGQLVPGDVVPVYVDYGWFQLNDLYRITKITLDPRTELMTVSINPEVDWSLDDGA